MNPLPLHEGDGSLSALASVRVMAAVHHHHRPLPAAREATADSLTSVRAVKGKPYAYDTYTSRQGSASLLLVRIPDDRIQYCVMLFEVRIPSNSDWKLLRVDEAVPYPSEETLDGKPTFEDVS